MIMSNMYHPIVFGYGLEKLFYLFAYKHFIVRCNVFLLPNNKEINRLFVES